MLAVRVINLDDDEATLIPVDKSRYKVSVRDESDSRQTIFIEPIKPFNPKQEDTNHAT